MTFLSIPFFFLFAVVMLCMLLCKQRKQQHFVLLVVSYVFYAYWDIRFLFLLLFQTYFSYRLAKEIEKNRGENEKKAKKYLLAGTIVSLVILGFFKYWNFFMGSFCTIFHITSVTSLSIILPVGISFYTFQALSYLIDVYREDVRARESFWDVSLYVAFFPQLVAGPIVRSTDFLPQLDDAKSLNWRNIADGLQIFLFGAIKKAVIADRLSVCVDSVFGAYGAYSGGSIILATLAYAMQIYCDFSGYSDMAIGIAKMIGYNLCENFNLPYLASNPSEFWRRWHISLSSWFRDYVYIPLGGNRKGKRRTYLNLFLTMVLSGLWHGASWNFVLWGAIHGAACVVHRLFTQIRKRNGYQEATKMGKGIAVLLNFVFVCISWVFFRAESIGDAFCILSRMFTLADGVDYCFVFTPIFLVLSFAASLWAYLKNKKNGYYPLLDLNKFSSKIILGVVIWLILAFFYPGENAFIYFQF